MNPLEHEMFPSKALKNLLPIFPKTAHVFGSHKTDKEDTEISFESFLQTYQNAKTCVIQEKIDGANVRVFFDGVNEPIIGNRDKILKKAYIEKETPAKLQFRALWTWVYEHRNNFKELTKLLGETPVVFTEWCYAQHTIHYSELPALFMPFDLYSFVDKQYLDPTISIAALTKAGFHIPEQIYLPPEDFVSSSKIETWKILANGPSWYGAEKREGIYIKFGDNKFLTHRYKIVAPWFVPRTDFNETKLKKNKVNPSLYHLLKVNK